jgi:hypothetical protein
MSWAADVYSGIRKVILLEDRLEQLTEKVHRMGEAQLELDRRLLRIEAKFELLEKMAAPARHKALPPAES